MATTTTRHSFLITVAVLCLITGQICAEPTAKPIPVIYDTDLGEDIDDTWALCFLLNSPEVDLKLVTTGFGDATAKAQLVAKILERMDRDDVPIAIGKSTGKWPPNYIQWARDTELASHSGGVTAEGVGKLVETIRNDKSGRLKLLAMGPLQNVAAALQQDPTIARKVELVAMAGSIRKGYGGKPEPDTESNVRCEIEAAQQVLAAEWKRITIAPLDTAGLIQLTDERYRHIATCDSPAARTVIETYRVFEPNVNWANHDTNIESSTLYDTLAVALAWSDEWVDLEQLPLVVTQDGHTRIDKLHGHPVFAATSWKDQAAFEDVLVRRIAGSLPPHGTRLAVTEISASANEKQAKQKLRDGVPRNHGDAWEVPVDKQPEWFQLDLGGRVELRMVKIAFANGNVWQEKFDIKVSDDGERWKEVLDAISGGETRAFEGFPVSPVQCRYVRVTLKGHGSWHPSPVGAVRVYGYR